MTSSRLLADLALRSLRKAAAGGQVPLDRAAQHDLDEARRMSAAERMARLNDILRMVEMCGTSASSPPPRIHGELKL